MFTVIEMAIKVSKVKFTSENVNKDICFKF